MHGVYVQAMAVYWVSEGIDRCRVGFLPRYVLSHAAEYDGKLLQVTELYKHHTASTLRKKNERNHGVCLCALIDTVKVVPRKKNKRTTTTNSEKKARSIDIHEGSAKQSTNMRHW